MDFSGIAKVLIIIGAVLVCLGVLFLIFPNVPYLGKLPGDIYVKKKNFTFFFPITTCIILSIIISLILYLFKR
jgi:uncharacterized protein HemY